VNQAPHSSGLGPTGFNPYRKYNSPSACAVSEPQSANGDIRLINVYKNTRTVPICALTRAADPSRRGLSSLHFCLGQKLLGSLSTARGPCLVVRCTVSPY